MIDLSWECMRHFSNWQTVSLRESSDKSPILLELV